MPHGKKTRILMNQFDLSQFFQEFSAPRSRDLGELTGFQPDATDGGNRIWAPGYGTTVVNLSGKADFAADTVDAVMSQAFSDEVELVFTAGRLGLNAVGEPAEMCAPFETSYEVSSPFSDAVGCSAAFQANGPYERGVVLHERKSESAIMQSAAVDNTVPTTNGGVSHLHVVSISGITSCTIKVQHSLDGATWTDLDTFAAVTAVGSQRRVVAPGTTVNRRLRAAISAVTGTGTVVFVVTFARR
jgi:hypothetical protein